MADKRTQTHGLTFAVLATGVTAYALLQSLVIPVLPTIREMIGTSANNVTWVLTAYLLSASVFTPIMGRIGDMIGKKRVFVASLVVLAVGCVISALAPNLGVMILGRVVQGCGGGVLPLGFGIIRDEFPAERVAGAVGSIAAITAVGSGFGLVVAGPIDNWLGTRWLFWLPTIAIAAASVAAYLFVPESPVRTPGRVSWPPALLLSGSLVCLLLPLSQAPLWGWLSVRVLGLMAAAVVLAVLWVWSELRAETPLIDMNMMRRKAVWTNNLAALLIGIGMYSVFGFLPEFLQTDPSLGYGFGASNTQSGLIMLPSAVFSFLGGHFCGRLAARYGAKLLVVAGSIISAGTMASIGLLHHAWWQVAVAAGIQGFGLGIAFAAMSGLIVASVPAEQTGVASGMNANIRTIGGSIGAALFGSIVSSHLSADHIPEEAGFTSGFLVISGAFVVAALAAMIIPVRRTSPLPLDEPAHAELAIVAGGTVVGDKPE